MPEYNAPLRDMRFLLNDVFDAPALWQRLPRLAERIDADTADAILEEAAKVTGGLLAPLNRSGDEEGAQWQDGAVRTPAGFREAYATYAEGGWVGLTGNPAHGGMGMPKMLAVQFEEMMYAANASFSLYSTLSAGACLALDAHGSEELKNRYLPNMYAGTWAGSMCLTEPHAGTDLGIIRTKAEPQADGSYRISGTKIFITGGEQDLTENIIHLVLAKLPDAPAGPKGISLFLVPKVLVNADGSLGEKNSLGCGSIEHKMGIKASATCVMNFDGATGFLIGPPNKGLECMFTFMNSARIGTAIQGVATAELAYQGALAYARERRSMRALSGTKEPDQVADSLMHHGDVRRMLLTQKAIAEGGRALVYLATQYADRMIQGILSNDDAEYERWDDKLGFLTPILKGCLTELGLESANLGMQVFGGHGYIREHGMEQIVRDARIATLYEGTTGIQALDLLGRKVLGSQGKLLRGFTKLVHQLCQAQAEHPQLKGQVAQLAALNAQWGELTQQVGLAAMKNADEVGAASVDYLMFSGYVTLAYFWLRIALVAREKLDAGSGEAAFYEAKLATADFYFSRLLPRTAAHAAAIQAGAAGLMSLSAEQFSL